MIMLQRKHQLDGKLSSENRFRLAWLEETISNCNQFADYMRQHLGARFQSRTFDSFKEEENQEAKQKCLDYLRTYEGSERNSLLIVGNYGTGKTHLACAIANKLIDEGIPILFDTFSGYLEKLKAEFDTTKRCCLENMKSVSVLFIDDIGKEKQTEWTRSIMFDIINTRYEDLLPTIITSNISGKELEEYLGGATYSRLCEMCKGVMVKGVDQRKIKREEKV